MRHTIILTTILAASTYCASAQVTVQSGGTLFIGSGATVAVEGNVSLGNGSTLINNGIVRVGNTIGVASDFVDNAAAGYNYGTGRFVFTGTGNQNVNTLSTFERIDMEGSSLALGNDITANKWYLIKGVINTGAFKAIAPGNTQLAVEADASNIGFANGWFNGTLRRFVNPATVNNYVFPVGNASRVNVAELDNLTANPLNNITSIDAFFAPKAGTDAGLAVTEQGSMYVSIHNGGVWHITPNAAPSSGKYNLKLYLNGFSGLVDNQFTILRRPEGSLNGADWSVPAGSTVNPNGGSGRMVTDGFALRTNMSSFSEFGIGLLSAALPVKLTGFTVRRATRSDVQVSWQTQTEQNNKGFEVERRLETATNFTTEGFVASKAAGGNSTLSIDYAFTDLNSYSGVSYYRLKQIDLDERAYYSLIKAVKGESTVNVLIWPNPNEGQFSIRLEGISGQKEAYVIDLSGKILQKIAIKGQQQVSIRNLPVGTYVLSIPDAFGPGEHFKEKVMVVR
jgi:hypothetical protein